ncbi:nuclease-related domain-containing protein [Bacillus sp. JJ634]
MDEKEQQEKKAFELFGDIFSSIYNESKDYYEVELLKYLMCHTLVVFQGKGLYAKVPTFLDPDPLITNHVKKLDLTDAEYNGRGEITEVCNKILNSLIEDFQELTKQNPMGYLICLLTYLERSVLGTFASFTWIHDKLRHNELVTNEKYEFGKVLSDSFLYLFEENNDRFNGVFKNWEGFLGLDKFSFEITLEIVCDSLKNLDSSSNIVNKEKALEYSRAIGTVMHLRDNANNEIFSLPSLTITNEGLLQQNKVENFEDKFLEFQEANIHWLINKSEKKHISSSNLNRINRICKAHLGFSLDEIVELATSLLNYYDSNTWLISTLETFPGKIQKFFNKDAEDIKRLLSSMVREPGDNNYLISKRPSRPLRKSLILYYNDWFISPSSIFYFALNGLYNDIIDGTVDNEELLSQLERVYQNIDNEFEVEIANKLRQELEAPTIHNVEKIYIDTVRFKKPPGQIDIICMFKDTLFVIECKNFPFKYNTQSIGNEIKKTKTTFSYKLQKKIEFVEENLDLICRDLTVDKTKITKVSGIFITNNFSFAQIIDGINFPVLNQTNLLDWFNHYEDNL